MWRHPLRANWKSRTKLSCVEGLLPVLDSRPPTFVADNAVKSLHKAELDVLLGVIQEMFQYRLNMLRIRGELAGAGFRL